MESPFPFQPLLIFGFFSTMLLTGVLLRARIQFIQKFLFPSCLIGGLLGLLLINSGLIDFEASTLETFAYHFFNISFISVGLTRDENKQKNTGTGSRNFLKGSLWMALIQGITFPLQAILGGCAVLVFGLLGFNLFKTFGFLSPLGFNEGPGQALSFGKVWEGVGFEHAATIGLTFAAIGFFFAFFIGVPLANWGIRRGISTHAPQKLPREFLTGIFARGSKYEPAGKLRLHSGNIDTLAFQASLIGGVYIVTYFFVKSLGMVFGPDVAKMLWGVFFFFGLGVAIVVKSLLEMAGVDYLIDPGIQRRITGWAVDFLIVSTVTAIQLIVVWEYFIPILVIALTNGLFTTVTIIFLSKRLWSNNLERMVAIFGTVTGTVPCGLLLLRIVDPDFRTSATMEIGLMNILVFPNLAICLLLVNAPIWWGWSLGLTLLAFLGVMLINLFLIRMLKFWGSPKF